MRLFYDNFLKYSGVSLTPSSEQSNLPAVNIVNEHKGKVWRSGATLTTEYVVIDFGAIYYPGALIIKNHSLPGSKFLEANSADSWGAPPFSATITNADPSITAIANFDNYQYWRIVYTKTSASDLVDVGVVYLGNGQTDILEQFDWGGLDEDRKDTSTLYRSIGGQTFADVRSTYRIITGKCSYLSQASSEAIRTLYASVGTHTSFFFIANTTDATTLVTGEPLYVKFASPPKLSISHHDGSEYKWDTTLKFEEQL